MLVEGIAVDLAEIAGLVDAQDHALDEAVEAAEQLHRRHFGEVPRADRVAHRMQQRVLADAGRAAEQQRVVDLLGRALHPVRQPAEDVAGVVGIDLADMVEPWLGLAGIAGQAARRPVEVEDGRSRPRR